MPNLGTAKSWCTVGLVGAEGQICESYFCKYFECVPTVKIELLENAALQVLAAHHKLQYML